MNHEQDIDVDRHDRYRWYLLTVLIFVAAFNQVDRLALGLMLEDIRVDLVMTDTQMGLLSGIAFALFYSIMGIPIARWADRGNRVTIIATTAAVWSVAVALCGAAANFTQLLLIRVGVAIGEAGCVPPAHSLLADRFSRVERPRALAFYTLANPLSAMIGYLFAGWANQIYGWRITFVLLGVPGLFLALLCVLTLRETRALPSRILRRAAPQEGPRNETEVPAPPAKVTNAAIFKVLWRTRTFRHLLMYFSTVSFFTTGLQSFIPTFFIRTHGLSSEELGRWLALIFGIGATLGVYVGGEWAARKAAGNETLQLQVMSLAVLMFGICCAAAFSCADTTLALVLLGLALFAGSALNGPIYALIQSLAPQNMRATAIAIMYLFTNLIGLGVGPVAAGALSDALRPHFGNDSLRYALILLCPGLLWPAWHLWRARLTVTADLPGMAKSSR